MLQKIQDGVIKSYSVHTIEEEFAESFPIAMCILMNYLLGVPILYVNLPNLVNAGLSNSHLLQIELDYIKENTSNYVPTPEELASCSPMLQEFSIYPCSNITIKRWKVTLYVFKYPRYVNVGKK